MIVKRVSQIGEPVIRARAKPVALPVPPRAKKVARDLVDSMRHYGLVGMAAPQIGLGLRIFVTEVRETHARRGVSVDVARVFINPKIVHRTKAVRIGSEGCGSVAHAELFAMVPRARAVRVTAYDEKGRKFILEASGLLSAVIQHEMDHLDGLVFLDRLPDMATLTDREIYLKKLYAQG